MKNITVNFVSIHLFITGFIIFLLNFLKNFKINIKSLMSSHRILHIHLFYQTLSYFNLLYHLFLFPQKNFLSPCIERLTKQYTFPYKFHRSKLKLTSY